MKRLAEKPGSLRKALHRCIQTRRTVHTTRAPILISRDRIVSTEAFSSSVPASMSR